MRCVVLALCVLLMSGCVKAAEAPPAATATSTATPAVAATTTSPTVSPAEHIWICTEGMAEVDAVVLEAIRAARGNTQSPTEMVATIQWAQDRAEILTTEAAGMARLSAALQAYADALGAAGIDEVTTARQEVDVACLMPN